MQSGVENCIISSSDVNETTPLHGPPDIGHGRGNGSGRDEVNVSPERFVLRHFYYGQFVRDGQPGGDMRLLARTHGLSDETVKEALRLGLLPPMAGSNAGSWAILRGAKLIPFVLVESEKGAAGQQMLHYVVLTSEAVRALGGNLRLLHPFIEGDMPAYDKVGNTLNPLVLSGVQPPSEEQEIDDILDFMMFTKNRMNVIEALLAAVVQNIPVVVVNAPEDPHDREVFIMGLLTLLPPSVRFAVTFATHTRASTKVAAQLRFVADRDVPPDALVFDWATGDVGGRQVQDTYSRFIVSQLRLDAEQVVRQTRAMTAVASWHMKARKSRLADALRYASQRLSIDDAVINGQPVEVADVARILDEDPTLTPGLREGYARHLMSFSMALGELDHSRPLGKLLGDNRALADTAYEMLQDALAHGAAGDIFDLMVTWMVTDNGPSGDRWVTMAHECAKLYLNDIIDDGDVAEVELFMKDVDRAGVAVEAERLLPDLVEIALPLAEMNPALARTLFLIACKHVTTEALYTMLLRPNFLVHMPEPIRDFVTGVRTGRTRPKLLLAAAGALETAQRLIMVRLVQLAIANDLPGFIDTGVLRQLVKVALSDWSHAYGETFGHVVAAIAPEQVLRSRPAEDGKLILSLLLATGAYNELARQMMEQSRLLYRGDRQLEFAILVARVFAETPIPAEELPAALETLYTAGMRSLPLAMAYIGTLDSHEPSDIPNAVADDVTDMLDNQPLVLSVLPLEAITSLVAYQFKRRNEPGILRAVALVPPVAGRDGEAAAPVVAKLYQRLTATEKLRHARDEMLRGYIRLSNLDVARQIVARLSKPLGREAAAVMEGAYVVKVITQDTDIETFALALGNLADFLFDPAVAYTGKNTPTQKSLISELDSIPGGLEREDRRQIAEDVLAAATAACALAEAHARVRGASSDSRIEGLLKGEVDPQSALEIMQVMGGALAQGRRVDLRLDTRQTPYPLPRRTAGRLLEESAAAHQLMAGMVAAFPADEPPTVTAKAVREEIESIWRTLEPETQRKLLEGMARDLQRVAELVPRIVMKGDMKAVQDTGIGRRLAENRVRPRNVIEFYRFMAGYYLQRA